MNQSKSLLRTIKEKVRSYHGRRVEVNYYPGRNKRVRFTGVLVGVYPEIFTVLPDEKDCTLKTSYQYTEILCGEVKLNFVKDA